MGKGALATVVRQTPLPRAPCPPSHFEHADGRWARDRPAGGCFAHPCVFAGDAPTCCLTGKSVVRFVRMAPRLWTSQLLQNACATKLICRVVSTGSRLPRLPRRKFSFRVFGNCVTPPRIPPQREGRSRGRHETRGGEAVDVSGCSVALASADEQFRCGREVVWSWPPDAEVKPAAGMREHRRGRWGQDSRSPGRARSKR